ncbi:MAG TPA: transglutaminaseTgpA domain-containing protein, partial [Rhodoglobus sp.]|nr:transglutaminaseTgpA domain-containing protein [Rhodoglobus sp.]
EPYQAGVRGIVFGVLALVWLGWRRPTGRIAQAGAGRLRNRKLAGTAAVVAASVVLGGAAAFVTAPPNDERFVLREEIEPPFDPLDYPSPMAGFRHYTKQVTDDVLFTVEGLQPGDRVRLATLDAYTGKLWNVTDPATNAQGSGSFQLVGRDLPEPALITPDARRDVTFTIRDYDDVWIPSVGYPTELRFTGGDAADSTDDLRYNDATGTSVLTSGLREGDRYTMDAQVQQAFTPDELAEVQTADVELSPADGVPDVVTVRAQEYIGNVQGPIDQLKTLERTLVDTGFLSHGRASDAVPSRAGHGADRITDLFERSQMVGDQEQYATAFALMARTLGYPSRVVMGFAPEVAEGAGTIEVTGDDVTAWVEVAFDGVGWVSFDPTPEETDIPQDQVPKPRSEPQPQVRQPPRVDNDDEDLLSPVELEETDDDDNGLPFNLPAWVWVLALSILIPAALFSIPLLVIGAIKARRAKRRRTRGAGHERIAGAWEELADRYSELGYAVPPKQTRLMVATRLEQQLGTDAPRLRPLAVRTDEAVFSGAEIGDDRSEQVWTEAMAAVEVARAGLTRGRRLLARFRMRKARDWVSRVAPTSESER